MKKFSLPLLFTLISGLLIWTSFTIQNWEDYVNKIKRVKFTMIADSEPNYSNVFVANVQNSKAGRRNYYSSSKIVPTDLTATVSNNRFTKNSGVAHNPQNNSTFGNHRSIATRKLLEANNTAGNSMLLAFASSGKRSNEVNTGLSSGGGWGTSIELRSIGNGLTGPLSKSFASSDDEDEFEGGAGTNPPGSYNDAPVGDGTVLLIVAIAIYTLILFRKRQKRLYQTS